MNKNLTTRITEVTIYTDRARVTRTGSVDLEPGETSLVLSGLPQVMEEDSVRVTGLGEGITIRGVDVKADVLEVPEARQKMREEIDQLNRQLQALAHERDALDEQTAYYKALKTRTSEESGAALLNEETSFDRVTQIAEYIRHQLDITYGQLRDLGERQDALKEEIRIHETRFRDVVSDNVARGQSIYIAVEADGKRSFACQIEYTVKKAHWYPVYDIRLQDDNTIELTYMAQVNQKTGEDWNDVKLSLSTARTSRVSELPKAEAWYISTSLASPRYRHHSGPTPVPPATLASAVADNFSEVEQGTLDTMPPAPAAAVAAQPPPPVEIQQTSVTASASGMVVTYGIGTPVSVPGNGEPHKTTITICHLSTELDYVVVPRVTEEAYLRATITNTSEYTILPGAASIFHGNEFVGKTHLKTIASSEEFQIQLGVDDRIKVERELVKRDTGTRRIGTAAQTQYRYEIRLTNLLDKEAKITVEEPYPLSKVSDIKVKLDKVTPEPKEESELHVLTWEQTLSDHEQMMIEIAFTIERGRNTQIYGLDD